MVEVAPLQFRASPVGVAPHDSFVRPVAQVGVEDLEGALGVQPGDPWRLGDVQSLAVVLDQPLPVQVLGVPVVGSGG